MRHRAPVSQRNRQLAQIHIDRAQLGLDEPTYRALLKRVTADPATGAGGKDSSADMTPAERAAVIREMVRLGFKAEDVARRARNHPGRPKGALSPMLSKVEALLADSRRPWSYAHALAKRMFHSDRVDWLRDDQLHRVIAALQIDANRRAKGQGT